MEFDLNAKPIDQRGRSVHLERFIHGEICKVRPDFKAILHSHSPSVIPFGVTNVPLRPVFRVAVFLGGGILTVEEAANAAATNDPLVGRPWDLWKRKALGTP